jgi:hypothetical protein
MTDDTRGFINVIRDVLLREDDAGLSAEGVPANSAGGGQVDGIGIGPRGESGGIAHRKRKRIAKARDPKLFKKLSSEGHVEFDLLSDAGQRRFCEGKSEGAIEVEPILPNNPKEIEPNPRKKKLKTPSKLSLKRGPDASIALNPVIPTRFESVVDEGACRAESLGSTISSGSGFLGPTP